MGGRSLWLPRAVARPSEVDDCDRRRQTLNPEGAGQLTTNGRIGHRRPVPSWPCLPRAEPMGRSGHQRSTTAPWHRLPVACLLVLNYRSGHHGGVVVDRGSWTAPAARWKAAHGSSLTESAISNGAVDWAWHEYRWGVVFEAAFDDQAQWEAFRALASVQAALGAAPDPINGPLVHRGGGGNWGAPSSKATTTARRR